MRKGLEPRRDYLRKMAAATGMKILFGEVGCTSTAGAARCPWGWSWNGGYDGKEQADFMDAVFSLYENEP